MESREGEFYFDSPGIDAVCGLYVIAKPDELVQVTFSEFHVSCEDGLVAVGTLSHCHIALTSPFRHYTHFSRVIIVMQNTV